MSNILTVNLNLISKCSLIANDSSNYRTIYTNIEGYGIIEFLKNSNLESINQRIHTIDNFDDPLLRVSEEINLSKDGTYYYYRLILPSFEHYWDGSKFNVKDKYFIYQNEIYFSDKNLTSFNLEDVILIEDYSLIWDSRESDSQIYWYNGVFFSICKLKECVANKIKNNIIDLISKGCDLTCNTLFKDQAEIDFLFESLFILKYLIDNNRITEAQHILDLLTSCNGVCSEDNFNQFISDCNCGKTI